MIEHRRVFAAVTVMAEAGAGPPHVAAHGFGPLIVVGFLEIVF